MGTGQPYWELRVLSGSKRALSRIQEVLFWESFRGFKKPYQRLKEHYMELREPHLGLKELYNILRELDQAVRSVTQGRRILTVGMKLMRLVSTFEPPKEMNQNKGSIQSLT